MKEKWYQVVIYPKCFGFASLGNTIIKHPDFYWIGKTLQDYKPSLLKEGALVTAIT